MAGRPKTRTEENFRLTAGIISLIYEKSSKTASELAEILGIGDKDGKTFSVYKCGNQSLSPDRLKDMLLKAFDYGWVDSSDLENFGVRLQCIGVESNLLNIVLEKENENRRSSADNCSKLADTDDLDDLPQIFDEKMTLIEALLEQASREAALTGLSLGDVLHKVTKYYNITLEDAI